MHRLLVILIFSLAVSTISSNAQVSTFPSPPPLAPPAQNSSSSESGSVSRSNSSGQSSNGGAGQPAPAPAANASTPVTALSAATLTSMSVLDDKATLREGDSISFRVIEDRDDPVTRVVTDTGEIDFPYIGPVKVEGKTCKAVAVEVKKLLEVDYYKQATVIVGLDTDVWKDNQKPRDMAWVEGEVRDEGPVELIAAQPTTVSQIILRAGGFGDFADQRAVKVIHRNPDGTTPPNKPADLSNVKDVQVVDVKAIFGGKSNLDPVVKPGDYIIVPKRMINY